MKIGIYFGLVIVFALVVMGVGCQPSSNVNTNSSMNQNMMNRNSMAMNGNSMPMNVNMQMDSNMPMNDSAMKSDPSAASAPYDLQFIDTMTAHHQSAIDMAKMVAGKTQNAELKKFAGQIIADQGKEIAHMTEWRDKWYAGKPAAKNIEMSGMMGSMKMMMDGGMKKMEMASGKDFDLMFLDMMTPHHAGAVTMAKEALTKAEHPEIKTLYTQISKAQDAEIKMKADGKEKRSK